MLGSHSTTEVPLHPYLEEVNLIIIDYMCCYNRYQQGNGLERIAIHCSQLWGLKVKIQALADVVSGEPTFLGA